MYSGKMNFNKIKLIYIGAFQKHCSDTYRVNGLISSKKFDLVKIIDFRKDFNWYKDLSINCSKNKVDVVLINKGDSISFQTLKAIKSANKNVLFVYWYGDMRNEIPTFACEMSKIVDLVLVNHKDKVLLDTLGSYGAKVDFSHTATDTDVFVKKNIPERYDFGFFGGNYSGKFKDASFRETIVKAVLDSSKSFNLIGKGWDRGNPNLVYGDDLVEEMSKCRILITISNYNEISHYTSNRTWNQLASGFCFVKKFKGISDYFKDEKHCIFFEELDDFFLKANYYLDNSKERNEIYKQGRKLVKTHHTYTQRANKMFQIFTEMFIEKNG